MSKVIRKEQCPICLDTGQDNLAVYDDGSTYCFSCNTWGGDPSKPSKFYQGKFLDLTQRQIKSEACRFFGYQIGKNKTGVNIHIANYYDDKGRIIAQKTRTRDKKFEFKGGSKDLLYGQWKYSPNPNISIVIVEGEIDALTVAQETEFQRPVVSLAGGATSAKAAISKHLAWLSGFKYVVLAFDNDEAGKEAINDCIPLFEPGKVRIAQWPLKDANEMLMKGRGKEIGPTIYRAKQIVPERLVTVSDLMDRILVRPTMGLSWPWPSLTNCTYGFQPKEISIVVAANSIGKTEFVKDIMFHLLEQKVNVGLFSFEQSPEDTIRRLVGAKLGLKLHLPDSEWNEELIRKEADALNERIFLYDKAGSGSDDEIMNYIRYLAKAKGVKLIIIDNLKGLGGITDSERMINNMTKFQALKIELDIHIILLSHVAKDKIQRNAYVSTSPKRAEEYASLTAEDLQSMINKDGMEWETGRMPSKENVEGPSVICDLADNVIALARNTTASDEIEKRTTRVKILKARRDSSKQGHIFKLYYNNKGILEEAGNTVLDLPDDIF